MRHVSARTGETVDVVGETPDLLVMNATWPPGARRTPPHRHPRVQETWRVIAGRATVDIDGTAQELLPGQAATAAAGQLHVAWNPTDELAVVRIEMRPALRWHEFVRRLFAGEPPSELLAEFTDEICVG